ncbi:RraA family protein [Leucobacter sp. G161]|uniref:RraA family protein n=1 Tax=Leucobacter sp. G161 TaxID=663704 RepID=UPI00073C9F14|nr:RraA family protein [Leucobacter sp. G161]KUF07682.1 demethylmenaquinone methyltransferase [Leucobacter sp. G161]
MRVTVRGVPPTLPAETVESIAALSFPTLGHYLEEGFVDPEIRCLVSSGRSIVGPAVTVRTTATDSTALHHAAGMILPGQVMVIDTGGDRLHAPLGEVVATQLKVRGAAGVIVDGVVTDIDELTRIGVPVYARGTSVLTTKLLGAGGGGIGVPIVCGGVSVESGYLVLADANGVLALSRESLDAVWDTALVDDAQEPELLRAIVAGGLLGDLSGATELIADLNISVS